MAADVALQGYIRLPGKVCLALTKNDYKIIIFYQCFVAREYYSVGALSLPANKAIINIARLSKQL